MEKYDLNDLNTLINADEVHIKKLEELVQTSIHEEELLANKLVELEKDEDSSLGQRLADAVATFGGSWTFITAFGVFIFIWILSNILLLTNYKFDPYPFIFLNLVLSCLAALQAPVIMMSQNRQEDKDRRRARSDYMINLKSEMEIRGLHSKIDLLIAEEMKTLFKIQNSQLELLVKIQTTLDKKKDL